jgi:hypothetical protein
MVAEVCVRHRFIEEVPAVIIASLAVAGLLPQIPSAVDALDERPGRRDPLPHETANLRWFVAWEGGRSVGLATLRDVYDFATQRDVRQIMHVAGSRRACVELLRFIFDEADLAGLPVMGDSNIENAAWLDLMERVGGKKQRVVYVREPAR